METTRGKPTLMKGALGFWPMVGQTIAFTAPLSSVVTSLTVSADYAGAALPLAILIAVIGGMIWLNTPYQYSKKIASAGGFYTFTSKAVGPRYGIFDGLVYLFFEYAILANTTLFFAGVLLPDITKSYFGFTMPSLAWIPILIVFVLIFTIIPSLGIKPSVKYSLVGALLEISILVILGVTIIVLKGPANTTSVFIPNFSGGFGPFFEGVVVGTFLMTGASGAVYIGEETKTPRKTIKKAMLVSFALTGTVFFLVSYAFTIGWGPANMSTIGNHLVPGLILADRYLGLPFVTVMTVLLINSLFVAMVAPLNVLGRISYSFSRDGVMSRWFGKIEPKSRVPRNAILLMGLSSMVPSIIAGLILGPYTGFIVLITISSLSLYAGHILSNTALPFYFRKIREMKVLTHIVLPTISSIVLVFGIYYSVYPPTTEYLIAIVAMAIVLTVALVLLGIFASRHRGHMGHIGQKEAEYQKLPENTPEVRGGN
ncbi:MAG: APC family permease [Candidatus Thermoplasmatota archaeon]|nr:APC family permease [Candidatus Thermoplasmatota archaeon]